MPVVLIILGMIMPTAAAAREGQTRDRLRAILLTVGAALISRRKVSNRLDRRHSWCPRGLFKGREAIVAVDGPDE